MIAYTERLQPAPAPCSPRTVALVGRYAHRHIEDTMLCASDCDVVLVESIAHAYSKIKRVRPDLVIVCLSGDDVDGCQVLSMLALDSDTSQIPVLTFMTPVSEEMSVDGDPVADSFICHASTSVN